MAVYAPKRAHSAMVGRSDRPKSRPRLVFDEQHKFRIQNNRSHLEQSQQFPPCTACSQEADRRQGPRARPQSSYHCPRSIPPSHTEQRPSTAAKRAPPTSADLERLSQPKPVPGDRLLSNNCNWSNFIKKKSKYAIRTPYALCDLAFNNESSEKRPPFVNYGGRYYDKQLGEKRTFNSLAIHQLKHHEKEGQRLADILRERRLRLQAENFFRQTEERHAQAQDRHDRAARSLTEYRDSYRPPPNYNPEDGSSQS